MRMRPWPCWMDASSDFKKNSPRRNSGQRSPFAVANGYLSRKTGGSGWRIVAIEHGVLSRLTA